LPITACRSQRSAAKMTQQSSPWPEISASESLDEMLTRGLAARLSNQKCTSLIRAPRVVESFKLLLYPCPLLITFHRSCRRSYRHVVAEIKVSRIVSDQGRAIEPRGRYERDGSRSCEASSSEISLRLLLFDSQRSLVCSVDLRRVRSRPLRTRVVSGMPRRRSAVSEIVDHAIDPRAAD